MVIRFKFESGVQQAHLVDHGYSPSLVNHCPRRSQHL